METRQRIDGQLRTESPVRAWTRHQYLESLDRRVDELDRTCAQLRHILFELKRVTV